MFGQPGETVTLPQAAIVSLNHSQRRSGDGIKHGGKEQYGLGD